MFKLGVVKDVLNMVKIITSIYHIKQLFATQQKNRLYCKLLLTRTVQ